MDPALQWSAAVGQGRRWREGLAFAAFIGTAPAGIGSIAYSVALSEGDTPSLQVVFAVWNGKTVKLPSLVTA